MRRVLIPEGGDVLLNSTGTGTLGRSCLFHDSGRYIVDGHVTVLRTNKRLLDPRWLNAIIQTPWMQNHIYTHCVAGSTNQIELARTTLSQTRIPRPNVDEQARIAEVLDTLDEAIRVTELVVAKLETMRSGLLLQMVFPWLGDSEECPPDLMMASRSLLHGRGQLPSQWKWMRLDSLADVERGKFTYRPRNEPKLFGGNFPFIQTGDVVRALGREINTASQWLNEMGMRFSREFPAGTIAVTIAANIADTAILGIPMCFPDSVVGVVVHKPHNNRFVELCVRVAKLGLEARAPQSAQKNINLQDLRPLWIPAPPPEVQDRIAVAYEDHESRIRGEVTKLEKLRALKSGLSTDLLTGRVRVTAGATG